MLKKKTAITKKAISKKGHFKKAIIKAVASATPDTLPGYVQLTVDYSDAETTQATFANAFAIASTAFILSK